MSNQGSTNLHPRRKAENLALRTRLQVVILQHPQEPGMTLGTAQLVNEILENAEISIGLSWPNLQAVLGREVQAKHWLVLYLGSGVRGGVKEPGLYFVNRKGEEIPHPPLQYHGLMVLDGTWKQAKTLWWRNPWLLKLQRIVLNPKNPSRYGKRRREPRRECLSTLESIAEAFDRLGESPKVTQKLRGGFEEFLGAHDS